MLRGRELISFLGSENNTKDLVADDKILFYISTFFISWSGENNVRFIPSFVFRILVKMTKNEKNQLYCLCLKVTADFRNFITKTDEKQKTKDEMNRTYISYYSQTWS